MQKKEDKKELSKEDLIKENKSLKGKITELSKELDIAIKIKDILEASSMEIVGSLGEISEEKKKSENPLKANRRHFFSQLSVGIGSLALGSLLIPDLFKGGTKELASQPLGIPHLRRRRNG